MASNSAKGAMRRPRKRAYHPFPSAKRQRRYAAIEKRLPGAATADEAAGA